MDLSWLSQNYLTRGFWGDEAWTAGISRLPIKEIISITSQDFHPPFYYFLVHIFGAPSGFAEVPVRLISTFFFLLVPIVSFLLVRKFWSTKNHPSRLSSLLTSLLLLTSPILLTYAFEARSYGLLAFESVLSAYIFWMAKDERKGHYGWRIAYFLLGSMMVYTHYYAWFILASHAFYLLLFERKKIIPLLLSALGILAVQAPWLPTLFGQTKSVAGDYWIGAINERTHAEFFLRITGGDVTTVWQKPLAYIIGLTVLAHILYKLFKKNLTLEHKFLLTWTLIPTILPTVLSLLLFPFFFYRYLIFTSIPLLILFIYALKDLPCLLPKLSRLRLVFFFLLLLYLQLRVDYKIFSQHPRSMREATKELYQTKVPGDGPVYTVLPSFAEVMYYTAPHDQIIVSPEGLVQFSGKSLLDAYVRLGLTTIEEPPTNQDYWFLTPEKNIEHHNPQ